MGKLTINGDFEGIPWISNRPECPQAIRHALWIHLRRSPLCCRCQRGDVAHVAAVAAVVQEELGEGPDLVEVSGDFMGIYISG